MPAFKEIQGVGGSSKGHDAAAATGDVMADPFVQNLFVMRHGEQLDQDAGGVKAAAPSLRPWDPPLTDRGKLQAWRVGRRLRMEDWNVTRVVTSPFLRCVQTAAEVVAGLCMLPSNPDGYSSYDESPDASKIKAWIDMGLAERMNRQAIPKPPHVADKDSPLVPWTLELPELYALLPRGTRDTSVQPSQQKLPLWRESVMDAQYRYTSTFQGIANRFPGENILCITHGEGVKQSASMMWPRVVMYGVTYCAYTHAQRPNYKHDPGPNLVTGDWELLTESGPASGLFFGPSP